MKCSPHSDPLWSVSWSGPVPRHARYLTWITYSNGLQTLNRPHLGKVGTTDSNQSWSGSTRPEDGFGWCCFWDRAQILWSTGFQFRQLVLLLYGLIHTVKLDKKKKKINSIEFWLLQCWKITIETENSLCTTTQFNLCVTQYIFTMFYSSMMKYKIMCKTAEI